MRVAAFDIGSTNLRYALGDPEEGLLTDPAEEPTRPERLPEQVVEAVRSLGGADDVDAVCVATTGLVDHRAGTVEFDAARDADHVVADIAGAVESALGLPTALENDVNAAALGEYHFGGDDGCSCLAHVSFGSGIGAGVVVDGSLFRGENGRAAEVGVFSIRADDDARSTGVRGAWEAYCSGQGIPAFVSRLLEDDDRETSLRGRELEAADVFAAADEGDEVARECLDRIGRYNAAGLGNVVDAYDPGRITVSGSVATRNPDRLLGPVRERISEYTLVDPPAIELTSVGDDVGLYGACTLAGGESA